MLQLTGRAPGISSEHIYHATRPQQEDLESNEPLLSDRVETAVVRTRGDPDRACVFVTYVVFGLGVMGIGALYDNDGAKKVGKMVTVFFTVLALYEYAKIWRWGTS